MKHAPSYSRPVPCDLGPFLPAHRERERGPTRLAAEIEERDGEIVYVAVDPRTGKIVDQGKLRETDHGDCEGACLVEE